MVGEILPAIPSGDRNTAKGEIMSRSPAAFTTGVNCSFLLMEEDLKKFFDIVKSYDKEVDISIECSDGVRRELTTKKLLEYQNALSSEILAIRLSSSGESLNKELSISFRRTKWMAFRSPVTIDIQGPDEVVSRYRTKIELALESCRPWYDRLARIDAVGAMLTFFLVVSGAATVLGFAVTALGVYGNVSQEEPLYLRNFGPWLIAVLFVTMIFAVGLLGNMMLSAWFPLATFAINDGLKRHQTADNWRWILISSVVIPIVFGIVSLVWSVFL